MGKRNNTFTILSALGMILVILGHIDCNYLDFWGLFPYYSFHVMIFVFVSGYFYNPEKEDGVLKYVVYKAKRLLLPYFIWNVVYGVVASILHGFGFEIGGEISLYNIFVAPFVGGHQFMYNAVAWFVPALFLLEVCNVIGRKILGLIKINNEWIIFLMYLCLGLFAVYMAKRGSVYDYYKIPGRIMLMAPCFGMGRIYKDKLEKYDTVPNLIYLALLFAMNYILVRTHGGLAYSVVWVTGFANTIFTPFITAITGIALWLRIAKLLAKTEKSQHRIIKEFFRGFEYLGRNTYTVMMHQLIIFMGIKEIFYLMYCNGVKAFADFDNVLYHTDVYYTYVPGGIEAFKLIYLVLGISIPLLGRYFFERLVKRNEN